MLGAAGRILVTVGVLMLLFVVYELWGTNLQEGASQRDLQHQFSALLQDRPRVTTPPAASPVTTRPTTTGRTATTTVTVLPTSPATLAPADLPLPAVGDPVANIQIPKIGVYKTVVQGVTLDQLKRGPGHYPETPLPGQKGNVGIAGHRTTYGAPFHDIDGLEIGDEIVVTTLQGTFRYQVDSKQIVAPTDVAVLADKGDNRLTLTSCHPRYSARQRIVVSGVLEGKPVAYLKGQDAAGHSRTELPGDGGSSTAKRGSAAAARDQANRIRAEGGLDGTTSSNRPAFLWGALCALVWLAAWACSRLVERRTHRRLLAWTPYLVGAPVFLVVLYVFFENFSRLLPSNF